MDKLIGLGFAAFIVAVIGAVNIISLLFTVIQGVISRSLPTVEGQVNLSSIDEIKASNSDEAEFKVYQPRVRYAYTVDGTTYSSGRMNFSTKLKDREKEFSERITSKYHYSDVVNIYYNPKKPSQSVVDPGIITDSAFFWSLIGATLMISICLPIIIAVRTVTDWLVVISSFCLGVALGIVISKKYMKRNIYAA